MIWRMFPGLDPHSTDTGPTEITKPTTAGPIADDLDRDLSEVAHLLDLVRWF